MPDQHGLPEGVKRLEPVLEPDREIPHSNVARMQATPDGRFLDIADLPAIRSAAVEEERAKVDLERLGLTRCSNCDEGVVCGTDTERDPEGNLYPVPVQERCPDCEGIGWVNTRAIRAVEEERKRLREALVSARFACRFLLACRQANVSPAWIESVQKAMSVALTAALDQEDD